MAWTDEMVEKLRHMWAEGKTANEIAKVLDVSKNSIVGKVHRLCLTARPSPIKKKSDKQEDLPLETESQISEVVEPVDKLEAQKAGPEKKQPETCLKETHKVREKKQNNGAVKLIDLDSHTCRWPIGDPRDDDFCFCGKKVRAGQTYCDEHSQVAYVKANIKK